MASVNRVILIGNLGREPETRHSPSGTAVCNVSIATTRKWKDKASGEKREETDWHRVVFYDRLAEIAGEYLKKGNPVYVEGRLKTRKWTDKDGQDKYVTEIIAESLQLLGGRDDEPRGERRSESQQSERRREEPKRQEPRRAEHHSHSFDDMDDDIPFANPYRGKYSYVV